MIQEYYEEPSEIRVSWGENPQGYELPCESERVFQTERDLASKIEN